MADRDQNHLALVSPTGSISTEQLRLTTVEEAAQFLEIMWSTMRVSQHQEIHEQQIVDYFMAMMTKTPFPQTERAVKHLLATEDWFPTPAGFQRARFHREINPMFRVE